MLGHSRLQELSTDSIPLIRSHYSIYLGISGTVHSSTPRPIIRSLGRESGCRCSVLARTSGGRSVDVVSISPGQIFISPSIGNPLSHGYVASLIRKVCRKQKRQQPIRPIINQKRRTQCALQKTDIINSSRLFFSLSPYTTLARTPNHGHSRSS